MARERKTRGLIRSLNRSQVRDDRSPRVVAKSPLPPEGSVCARCGSVYMRKTWRHDRAITEEQIAARHFAFCPACIQMSRREGQGRVTITGKRLKAARVEIERRINNAAAAASRTQPERRIISMGATDSGDGLDVITTSQKLAHRIAHEVKKAFGGRATYDWKDDGTLRAAVDLDARK